MGASSNAIRTVIHKTIDQEVRPIYLFSVECNTTEIQQVIDIITESLHVNKTFQTQTEKKGIRKERRL